MEHKTIEKIFGERKLASADVGVVRSLAMLGPWGVALIAAYLAGQGLVQLAEKIQAMRGPTAPTIPLTGEEEAQIREAIQMIESEQFARMYPESMEWIREHAPEAVGISRSVAADWGDTQELLDNALSELIESPFNDPGRENLCDKVKSLMTKLGQESEDYGPYAVPGADMLFRLAFKWLDKKCGPSLGRE